jgi:hydrogenase nickel incorporation protein HypA/HybF
MHELSVADAIVATAARHADGRRVALVEVKIGHLRQVVPSALEFAFGLVSEGTSCEGAELRVDDIPARVACRRCGAESEALEFPLACASCGGVDVDVVAGEELYVEALELDDEPEPVSAARR